MIMWSRRGILPVGMGEKAILNFRDYSTTVQNDKKSQDSERQELRDTYYFQAFVKNRVNNVCTTFSN